MLKNFFNNFSWQRIFPLFILALADVAVFAFPSYMANFIPALENKLGILDQELSQIRAIYGYVSIGFYFIGAYIADKFRAKILVAIGLILMTILGIWYGLVPIINYQNYWQTLIIYIGFSIAIKTFFWGPLWKLVATQGEPNEVGILNGIQGSLNGLLGAGLAIIGIIFFFINPQINGINLGFSILCITYVLTLIISFSFLLKYVKEDKINTKQFNIKSLVKMTKNFRLWLLGFLVMGIYMFQMGLSVYTDYLKNIFHINTTIVFFLGISRTYLMRFISSPIIGKISDRAHSYIFVIILGLIIAILLTIIAIILPGFNNDFDDFNYQLKLVLKICASLIMILLGATAWCLVTIRWSPISTEIAIKKEEYGAAVNFISIIAFTPDAFFQQIRSIIQKNHNRLVWIEEEKIYKVQADQLGNQLIFIVALSIGIFGLICGIILYFWNRKLNKKTLINTIPIKN